MNTNKFINGIEILDEYYKTFPTGKNKYYKCKCKCGRIFNSAKLLIDSGVVISCNKKQCNRQVLKMIGKKFGRLTVISHENRTVGYLCKCDCGNTTIARTYALKNGGHKSCGCLQKEEIANRSYKGKHVAVLNGIYKNYKSSAKRRNYIFKLTKDEFLKLIKSPCYYCGLENSMVWKSNRHFIIDTPFEYNGIDRKNNDEGYTTENSVSCCRICNNSKSTLSLENWKIWIKRIYEKLELHKN